MTTTYQTGWEERDTRVHNRIVRAARKLEAAGAMVTTSCNGAHATFPSGAKVMTSYAGGAMMCTPWNTQFVANSLNEAIRLAKMVTAC